MSRISLINITLGFFLLVITGFMGVFSSFTLTEAFLKGRDVVPHWEEVLFAAAHGHLGLFAILHIVLGLTFPYARSSFFVKKLQSLGVFMGCVAMGPLLVLRGILGPADSFSPLGLVIGGFMSLSMAALLSHGVCLLSKLRERY